MCYRCDYLAKHGLSPGVVAAAIDIESMLRDIGYIICVLRYTALPDILQIQALYVILASEYAKYFPTFNEFRQLRIELESLDQTALVH